MIWEYLKELVSRSFRDFHARTDIWYGFISVALSGATGAAGARPVSTLTPNEIAWYVFLFVAFYAALRIFILVPYRMWAEKARKCAGLEGTLNSEEHKLSTAMLDFRIELRKRLSEEVSEWLSNLWVQIHRGAIRDDQDLKHNILVNLASQLGDEEITAQFGKISQILAPWVEKEMTDAEKSDLETETLIQGTRLMSIIHRNSNDQTADA